MSAGPMDFPLFHSDHTYLSDCWDDWEAQHNLNNMLRSGISTRMELDQAVKQPVRPLDVPHVSVHPNCSTLSSPSLTTNPGSISDVARDPAFAIGNKRRKPSKYSKPMLQHDYQYDIGVGSQRKSISEHLRRERNRNAASKCRAKSKAAEKILKECQQIAQERNRMLRATFQELNNETLMLKHELLCHSDCNHPAIDKYLMRAAEQISKGLNQLPKLPQSSERSS